MVSPPRTPSPVVLVLEEHRALLDVLLDALTWEGYDVVPARGGDEAAEVLRARPVHLLVADTAPGSGDASPLAELVAEFPELPIVEVIDRDRTDTFFQRWSSQGNRIRLPRPFRLADLLAACREVVDPDAAADGEDEEAEDES